MYEKTELPILSVDLPTMACGLMLYLGTNWITYFGLLRDNNTRGNGNTADEVQAYGVISHSERHQQERM